MSKKLTPDLENEVIAKSATGWSNRQVADWLRTEHGVAISHQAIGKTVKGRRTERAEVTKAVVREKLAGAVVSDLDRISREQRRVERLSRRLHRRALAGLDAIDQAAKGEAFSAEALKIAVASAENFAELALKASDRVKALADRKLHYAGADTPDDSVNEFAGAEARLSGKLARLAAVEAPEISGEPDAAGEGGS